MILVFDEIVTVLPLGWILQFDERQVFIPESQSEMVAVNRIKVVDWLAEREGLEVYEDD
jgi:hypothetical protein